LTITTSFAARPSKNAIIGKSMSKISKWPRFKALILKNENL